LAVKRVTASLQDAKVCLDRFLAEPETVARVSDLAVQLAKSFEGGGKVLAAGNGGSMADAMHFAEELTGRFRKDRRPLPAIAFSDPTHLSCVANDYGFDHVFERLTVAFATPGDTVVLLSTSGNSENLLLAAEAAKSAEAHVFGFLGRDGGRLLSLCDSCIIAPGASSDRIQEIHMVCLHIVVETVENLLGLA
jgi:D-sedoheptulose 7-phosphate isomerase